MRWDDLRVLAAVVETGSVRAAASALKVSHPTVSRHLRELQADLGSRLIERVEGRFVTTPAGEELLAVAKEVGDQIDEVERRVTGRDQDLAGTVRITVPDALVPVLARSFSRFATTFPQLQVELIVDDALLDITRRDADIAVRFSNRPPEHLIGRRLATAQLAAYASKSYARETEDVDELAELRWVGFDDKLMNVPAARWMRKHIPKDRVAFKVNSTTVLQHALRAGIGAGLLGTFLGDADRGLVAVTDPIEELDVALWLLTHADLRKSAAVRACMDHLADTTRRFW